MTQAVIPGNISSKYLIENMNSGAVDPAKPYGAISYNSSQSSVKHTFVLIDPNDTIRPTVHGMSAEDLVVPKRVGLVAMSTTNATILITGSSKNKEQTILNTGSVDIHTNDVFVVRQPTPVDILAQQESLFLANTFGQDNLYGGLLATHVLSAKDWVGALLEYVRKYDNVQLADINSPMLQQTILGIYKMVDSGRALTLGNLFDFQDALNGQGNEAMVHDAVAGLQQLDVETYINTIMRAFAEISFGVFGYATGVMVRSGTANKTVVKPGETFVGVLTKMGVY